jgi:hypothetical protein
VTVLQIIGAFAVLAGSFYAGCIVGVAVTLAAAQDPDAADELNTHRHSGIGDLERHRNRNN